jgi:hypothetical protein
MHSKLWSSTGSRADWKGRTVWFMRDHSELSCLQELKGPSVMMLRVHRYLTEVRFALAHIVSEARVPWRERAKGQGGIYDVAFPLIEILSAACRGMRSIDTSL